MSATSSYYGVANVNSNTTAALLIELAAMGAQDVMLTCDPKCSLFHQSYCRITNFAMGEQTLSFQSAPSGQNFSASQCSRAEVLRSGDLLGPVYFDACLSGLPRPGFYFLGEGQGGGFFPTPAFLVWCSCVGYALLEETRAIIGSQLYERQKSEYLLMHDELSRSEGKRASAMIGDYGIKKETCALESEEYDGVSVVDSDEETLLRAVRYSTRSQKILAPLPLFWTKHAGNYLNVVGAQYHNIAIEVDTRAYGSVAEQFTAFRRRFGTIGGLLNSQAGVEQNNPILSIQGTATVTVKGANLPNVNASVDNGVLSGMCLLALYVHLDTAERRLKAQTASTKRIVYVQDASFDTSNSDCGKIKEVPLHFNQPITRLLWAWRGANKTIGSRKDWFFFGDYRAGRYTLGNAVNNNAIYVATQEIVPTFNEFEILVNNHSRTNQSAEYYLYAQAYQYAKRIPKRLIYSYSFALYPDSDDTYSGSMNLSRIDNVVLRWHLKSIGDTTTLSAIPVINGNQNLSLQDSVTGRQLTGTYFFPTVSPPSNLTSTHSPGTMFVFAETINFYKQAAGMFGLLFAN